MSEDTGGLFGDEFRNLPKKRNRGAEGAIRSERSYQKHRLIRQAVNGQIGKASMAIHRGRFLLIDGNAGDGLGVDEPQSDFFDDSVSRPTPATLIDIGSQFDRVDVVLCERDEDRRISLRTQFPNAVILNNHAEAIDRVRDHHAYAIWVSDPCGPSDHGVEHMRAIADRIPLADFVVAFNEGAVLRMSSTQSDKWALARARYMPMIEPDWWLESLDRSHIAETPITYGSANFRFRVRVISNSLSSGATRAPFRMVK